MHAVTQAHRVELAGIGTQRDLDVAQAFAPRQLRKRHHAELLGAIHPTYPGVARVAFDHSRKARPRHKLHDLREQRFADIHDRSPGITTRRNYTNSTLRDSNRHQTKSADKPRQYWFFANAQSIGCRSVTDMIYKDFVLLLLAPGNNLSGRQMLYLVGRSWMEHSAFMRSA